MASSAAFNTPIGMLGGRRSTRALTLGGFAIISLIALLPFASTVSWHSQGFHIPFIASLGIAAGAAAWGTWTRFKLDHTSESLLLTAAFVGLGLLYLPHAFYDPSGKDPVHFFFGPASRFVFGLFLLAAMIEPKVPRALKNPKVAIAAAAVGFAGVVDLAVHGGFVRQILGADPVSANRMLEVAALITQSLAMVVIGVKYYRTKRPFLATAGGASIAMALGSAVFIFSAGWQLRWWIAHLGLFAAAVILFTGVSRRLANAIDTDELILHFQPKIDLHTRELAGVEALVRWLHPKKGIIGPGVFIPVVEKMDLIKPLTLWVLKDALRQHMEWRARGLFIPVAVNLSARLLGDDEIVEVVRQELEDNDVDPSGLELELTETALLEHQDKALEVVSALAALGVKLSIDDFGTGYSSLSYLKRLPVAQLKIDQSFIKNLDTDDDDFIIVRSTIDLAHSLGKIVVAEGVETEAVGDLLKGLDCNTGQGYFWSRPLDPQTFDAWVASRSVRTQEPAPATEQ